MNALSPIAMRYRDDTATFPKGWYCVAESAVATADKLLPVSYLDSQLIVYRAPDGTARVADAYCPHLGAHLASHDGCLTEGEVVCPFHKWRFDASSGSCVAIPYTKIIPPQARLTLYPVREIDGMILMWYHPEGAAPDFEPFDSTEIKGGFNWVLTGEKIRTGLVPFRDLFENLFDTAHIQQLHNSHGLPDISKIDRTDYGLRVDYAKPSSEEFPINGMEMHFTGLGLLSHIIDGEGFGFLQVVSATPVDRERFALRSRMYVRDTGSKEMNEALGGAFVARVMMEIDQDAAVLDYKKHLKQPLICAGDGPIMRYRTYARDFFQTASSAT